MNEGKKFDQEKLRMELVDPYFIEGVAAVLTFGAKKYSAENWRGGIQYKRIIGACKRHLSAIERGEDIDPETGLQHGYHLACELMFLTTYIREKRTELDDRVYRPLANRTPDQKLAALGAIDEFHLKLEEGEK